MEELATLSTQFSLPLPTFLSVLPSLHCQNNLLEPQLSLSLHAKATHTMQDTQGEVMWPKLMANKLLRRCMGNSRFLADSPNVEVSSGRGVSSTRHFLLERMARNQTDTRKYKLYVSTWNVGGVAPPDNLNLEDWLDSFNNPCDIYVLGFQEVVPLSAGNVLGTEKTRISMKWNSLIRAALNKSSTSTRSTSKRKLQKKFPESKTTDRQKLYPYKDSDTDAVVPQDFMCIISKQMVGIFITVWARGNLRQFIRNPNVACVGCGIMGCLRNKGSVSVSFCLHETSVCFVCSHLASGGKEGDEIRRNSDAVEILSRTFFPSGPSFDLPRKILEHDRVVWLGDLNYRISMPEDTTRLLVEEGCWDVLLKKDQLRDELSEGGVFEDWQEGAIGFAPTYKYNPNSDEYYGGDKSKNGEKRRAPAWCDRILWYGKGMKQKQYGRGESRLSDHRPVRAVISVEVEEEVWSMKALGRFFLSDRFDMTQKEIETNTTKHEHKK